jgi:NADH-quinone oxidoreductase subunit E
VSSDRAGWHSNLPGKGPKPLDAAAIDWMEKLVHATSTAIGVPSLDQTMSTEIKTIFSPALAARFDRMVTLYPLRRSALIPMLLYAQDEVGYLSDQVISEVAARIEITELDVRNVISYYSLLHTAPAGKYHVQVCTNISCMLRGGNELFAHCKERLGIGNKETTPDKLFSLEEVECIGACSWAPAVQVNYDFHENLTPDKVDDGR